MEFVALTIWASIYFSNKNSRLFPLCTEQGNGPCLQKGITVHTHEDQINSVQENVIQILLKYFSFTTLHKYKQL